MMLKLSDTRIGLIILCSILGSMSISLNWWRIDPFMQTTRGQAASQELPEAQNLEGITALDSSYNYYYPNGRSISSTSPITAAKFTHPLGNDSLMCMPLDQIVILDGSNGKGWLLMDQTRNFAQNQTLDFGGYIFDAISANFMHNGSDQLMIAQGGNLLKMYDLAHSSALIWSRYFYVSGFPVAHMKIAAGEFNGDGHKDIALLQVGQISTNNDAMNLTLFDLHNNKVIYTRYFYNGGDSNYMFAMNNPNLIVGDLTGNLINDIAIIVGGNDQGWVIGDYTTEFTELFHWKDHTHSMSLFGCYATMVDFSGSGSTEIVVNPIYVCGYPLENYYGAFVVRQNALHFPPYEVSDEMRGVVDLMGQICSANVGSSSEEILAVCCPGAKYAFWPYGTDGNVTLVKNDNGEYSILATHLAAYLKGASMAAGDLNCDGRDSLIFCSPSGTNILDFNNKTKTLDSIYSDTNHTSSNALIISGAYYGEGLLLNYTGVKWTYTSTPGVMLAMAAPPIYVGTSQHFERSYTAYGSKTSYGSSKENTIGTSSSTKIGIHAAYNFFPTIGFSVDFNHVLTDALSYTNTLTSTQTITTGYLGGASDNSVIFQLTTYNNYEYVIAANPANVSLVGKKLAICVPEAPLVFKATVSWFNTAYPNAVHIGNETFNATVGQPWTYPKKSAIFSIAPKHWQSGTQTLGMGTQYNTVEIDLSTVKSSEMSNSWSSSYTMDISGCGNGYMFTDATFGSRDFITTAGNSCVFEGAVGDMETASEWEDLNYTFGLFVYDFNRTRGINYRVVNYWVDGASAYTPPLLTTLSAYAVPMGIWGATILIPLLWLKSSRKGNKRR